MLDANASAVKSYVKFSKLMSRIGKQELIIPEKVTVEVKDRVVTVKGPKGELSEKLHDFVQVEVTDNQVVVSVEKPNVKAQRSMWGTFSSLVKGMIEGVSEGFAKKLEINGVGYGWQVAGKKVTVKAGYSHPVEFQLPDSIEASVEDNVLTIAGPSKQQVGQVAANLRKIRTPEPYKGTGIKYDDEHIIRKAGKQAAGAE